MNIIFTSIGSYPWKNHEDFKNIGLVKKFLDHKGRTRAPVYFHVIDKQLLFLSVIEYGMSFLELSETDTKSLDDYQEDIQKIKVMREKF